MNNYQYHNGNINGIAGFWDENLEVPTVYLDPVEEPILDARDAWAQGTGTPDAATSSISDLSFRDILDVGRGVLQDITKYRAQTLPNGSRIYTTIDPLTGRRVMGTGTLTLQQQSLSTFIQQYGPMLLLGGVALMVLSSSGGKRHAHG